MEHRAIEVTLGPPARRIRRSAGAGGDPRLLAHDLRGIASCLALVADELRARGGRQAVLGDRVDRACRRLLDLGGAAGPVRSGDPSRLTDVLADAATLATALAGPFTHIATDGPEAALSASHGLPLFRILLNLLSNAVRATNETGGGRVHAVASARGAGDLVVTVTNDGTGLLGAARPGAQRGTGLGLVIAEALAADLGGALQLGASDTGTTALVLVLPGALVPVGG